MIKIIPHGWWWKRFFPKYRKIRSVMEVMVNNQEIVDRLYEDLRFNMMHSNNTIFIQSSPEGKNAFYEFFKKENGNRI